MRFNFLIYSPFPHYSGGRETWLWNVAQRLRARGHTIRIYSYRNHAAPLFHRVLPDERLRATEVPVMLSIPRLGPKLVRGYLHVVNMAVWTVFVFALIALRKHPPDTVFVGMGTIVEPMPVLMARKAFLHSPFICSVRGPHAENESIPLPLMKRIFHRLERVSTRRADLVIANGNDTHARLRLMGVDSVVVPNGVDLKGFLLDAESEPVPKGFPAGNAKIAVMTASLMSYRQIDTALEALAVCRRAKDAPDVRLVFAGKGDVARWRRVAEELTVADHVTFLGERRDIASILAHSDIVLALADGAHAGGFSMALLEAMAAGKAIVVSDNQYYRQLITDGLNGRIVPERDAEALGATILQLATDDPGRARLGRCARARAQEFDWEAVTDRVEDVASRVVAGCSVGTSPGRESTL